MTRRRIITYILIFIASLILIEAIALLMLYRSVADNKNYWQERAKVPGDLVYVALGDSAAQGIGASKPQKGYVGQIAQRLGEKTGKTVQVVNLSKSGAVINDVLKDQIPELNKLKPDLVTIEIGGNDVAKFDEIKFRKEFTELVAVLPKGTYVSNMPYFGSRSGSRPKAKQATEIIQDILKDNTNLVLVDLQTITEQKNSIFGYAADYFHPNDRAYKNWTDAFWSKIQENYDGKL